MELYLIIPIVILLFAFLGYLGFASEKRDYNGGYCRECHTPLVQFDTDSQGGRMFKCTGRPVHYGVDVSYPGIVRG